MEKWPAIEEPKVGDVVGVNTHGSRDPAEKIAYELKAIETDVSGDKVGVVWLPGDEASIRKYPLNKLMSLKR
jgi:hypothetical protein